MANLSKPEMRLKLTEHIQGFLADLAIEDDMDVAEIVEVEESMAELTEMLLDSLYMEVAEVHEDHVVVTLRLE